MKKDKYEFKLTPAYSLTKKITVNQQNGSIISFLISEQTEEIVKTRICAAFKNFIDFVRQQDDCPDIYKTEIKIKFIKKSNRKIERSISKKMNRTEFESKKDEYKKFIIHNANHKSYKKITAYNKYQIDILNGLFNEESGIIIVSSMHNEKIFYNYLRRKLNKENNLIEMHLSTLKRKKIHIKNDISNKKVLIKTSYPDIHSILEHLQKTGFFSYCSMTKIKAVIFQDINIFKNHKSLFADIAVPTEKFNNLSDDDIPSENETESLFIHTTNFSDILKRNFHITELLQNRQNK